MTKRKNKSRSNYPGAKKVDPGTAPTTPFTLRIATIEGKSVEVKFYGPSSREAV